jgi:predicted PurR-regulated permease PerM
LNTVKVLPAADWFRKRERALIPLENPIIEAYAKKISLMTRSMFPGIFVLSFVQGITMGFFYVLAGIPYAAF